MADLVLFNAHIYTMDPACPTVSAIAIRDDKILAVGSNESTRTQLPAAEAIDLQGRCIIPGLIDAHLHWEWVSLGLKNINCETPTLAELLRRVEERVRVTPPDKWLRGHGWNQNIWGGKFPTKDDLDRVAPNQPVYLTAKSGHAGWANSLALKLANVTTTTPDPEHGEIMRDDHGEPTGVFFEAAMELINHKIPQVPISELAAAMRDAIPYAHRVGLTSVHDFDGARALQAWQILKENEQLNLRVSKTIPVYLLDHAIALGLRSGFGDSWLRINSVKAFADGALGPRTASMIDPYEGEPENRGIIVTNKEEMFENVRKASRAGLSSTIHAIGDKANHDVIDVYAAIRQDEATRGDSRLRHRIEHVQLLHPDDFNRLAQFNIIASMQPIHATSDMLIAEKYWGRKRSAGGYMWRTQLNAGAKLAFGSDAPIESFDPLPGIHAAVTRRRADGTPNAEGWFPDQKLSVQEAVHGFTLGAAYASCEEKTKGSLARGKLADLVVLDQDIFTIDPMGILNTKIEATVIDGKFVWRNF